MEASELYKCLADPSRLRILSLLEQGPLCVCHLQDLLAVPQVKMSKQLASMKALGLIHAERSGTWMIYSLINPTPPLLRHNLEYLRHSESPEAEQLRCDLQQRRQLLAQIEKEQNPCPAEIYTCTCAPS